MTTSFRSEPFLWIHLAGLAVLPLCLELVWLGLAVGDPLFPYWLEVLLLAAVGILPILWMQWQRPFDIFSLLIVSLRVDSTTPDQRRILRLFKTPKHRFFSAIAAFFMLVVLWQIYRIAPAAATAISFLPQWHLLGLLIAAVAFIASNLFLQVPVSVLSVLSTREQTFAAIEPLSPEQISQELTIPGFRVNNILPTLIPEENFAFAGNTTDMSGKVSQAKMPSESTLEATKTDTEQTTKAFQNDLETPPSSTPTSNASSSNQETLDSEETASDSKSE